MNRIILIILHHQYWTIHRTGRTARWNDLTRNKAIHEPKWTEHTKHYDCSVWIWDEGERGRFRYRDSLWVNNSEAAISDGSTDNSQSPAEMKIFSIIFYRISSIELSIDLGPLLPTSVKLTDG